jgi:hypothetical protein
VLAPGVPIEQVIAQLTSIKASHPGTLVRQGKPTTRTSGTGELLTGATEANEYSSFHTELNAGPASCITSNRLKTDPGITDQSVGVTQLLRTLLGDITVPAALNPHHQQVPASSLRAGTP